MAFEEGTMTDFPLLKKFLQDNGLYSDERYAKFLTYFDEVVETNKVMNLTAITTPEDFESKHFIDSLLPFAEFESAKSVADIGSGAGFPAIPLAIVLPDVKFTLVDSLNKRVNFLCGVIEKLGLSNCIAVHSRAEDFAKQGREKFDVVTARAVAAMNILLEYTAPIAKTGGKVIAYKGSNAEEEIRDAKKAADLLCCKLEKTLSFNLNGGDERVVAVYKKIRPCDKKYPRGGNKPRTNPIV